MSLQVAGYRLFVRKPICIGIPGPPLSFLLGSLPGLKKEGILDYFVNLRAKYGPVYRVILGGWPVVVVADGPLARKIMAHQHNNFFMGPSGNSWRDAVYRSQHLFFARAGG